MEKLAPNNRYYKTLLPVIITFLVCIILISTLKNYLLLIGPMILITLVIGYLIIQKNYNKHANAFFDTDYLYLIYKTDTIKISKKNVKSIDRSNSDTTILGIPYQRYIITYQTIDHTSSSYSFLINSMDSNLETFKKLFERSQSKTGI